VKLKEWFKNSGHTYKWLANEIGVSEKMVYLYANMKKEPSLAIALKIKEKTNKKVLLTDLLKGEKDG
jgi:predicted transcriptional regulator